jgi:hypothetical protein
VRWLHARQQTTRKSRSVLVFEAFSYPRYSRRSQAFLVPRLVGDCHLSILKSSDSESVQDLRNRPDILKPSRMFNPINPRLVAPAKNSNP